jgi:hypothetical protein
MQFKQGLLAIVGFLAYRDVAMAAHPYLVGSVNVQYLGNKANLLAHSVNLSDPSEVGAALGIKFGPAHQQLHALIYEPILPEKQLIIQLTVIAPDAMVDLWPNEARAWIRFSLPASSHCFTVEELEKLLRVTTTIPSNRVDTLRYAGENYDFSITMNAWHYRCYRSIVLTQWKGGELLSLTSKRGVWTANDGGPGVTRGQGVEP